MHNGEMMIEIWQRRTKRSSKKRKRRSWLKRIRRKSLGY